MDEEVTAAEEDEVVACTEEAKRLTGRDEAETVFVTVVTAAGLEALAALISLRLPRRFSIITPEAGAGIGAETVAETVAVDGISKTLRQTGHLNGALPIHNFKGKLII